MTVNSKAPAPKPGDSGPPAQQPAITPPERDRSGPLGPKDAEAGPEGAYPDPDEYAGTDDH